MRSEEAFQESVRSMRNQTLRADRAGDYWTDDEKNRLKTLFDSGVGITEIALELGRTEPAVYQQIEKMDLYGRKQNPQRQRNGKKHFSGFHDLFPVRDFLQECFPRSNVHIYQSFPDSDVNRFGCSDDDELLRID